MRKMFKKISIIFLFLLNAAFGYSQITIEFPVERAVFQRNNNNLGFVNVYGNVKQDCDRVEARLVARATGQGVTTSWVTIDSEVAGMAYSGKIQNSGGWYKLEVRGIKNESVLFSSAIERVGIGEVFIIAGQSNAQGSGSNPNSNGAIDDRVNGFLPNYFDFNGTVQYRNLPEYLNQISFEKIRANSNIGPTGYTAYCYGELGDLLVSRLNVPVLFFNTAFTGTSSKNWVESSLGNQAVQELTRVEYSDGGPYKAFQVTLQSVNTLLGIRSVLWHQGEFDRFSNNLLGTSSIEHYNNLKWIIEKSRRDIGSSLPWVVSRASRYQGSIDQRVLDGQGLIISSEPFVWAGPSTDNIQPNRYDGGHIQNVPGSNGLTELASLWNTSLTDNFFSSSVPVMARDILKLRHYCLNQNSARLNLDNFYSTYNWSSGQRGNSVEASSGFYSVVVRDGSGNILRSGSIELGDVFPKTVPIVIAPDGLEGCVGKAVSLKVQASKYQVYWNNGFIGNDFSVNQAGGYTAQYRSTQNCFSPITQTYNVSFKAPPQKPNLTFLNGDGNQCEGQSISVAVTNIQGAGIKWSNGATSNSIVLNQALNQDLTATLYSLPNCPSETSDVVKYQFYPTPKKPSLDYSGPFYLKAESLDKEAVYNWNLNGNAIDSNKEQYLHLNQPGTYSVRASHDYVVNTGRRIVCLSAASEDFMVAESKILTGFSIFPNPATDGLIQVTSDGEKQNLNVVLYDELGRQVYTTHFDLISYPRVLDLRSKQFNGKYFLQLKYENQSKTFPLIFMK